MPQIASDDAQIVYEIVGSGPPVVLLHPFPACRDFWRPAAQSLVSRYTLVIPDLRGHGDTEIGHGPALMGKHAGDLVRILDQEDIGRAPVIGVSIGGYILFEFWRRYRGRVAALGLCNTKAQADTTEARNARLQAAVDVLERGTEPFINGFLPKAFGKSTLNTRPDLIDGARRMMIKMSPEDISLVQKGMAERPDSVPDLKTVNVPTMIVTGDEDTLTPIADAELMHKNIAGSQVKVISRGGHYAVWEQPEAAGTLVRQFLDSVKLG